MIQINRILIIAAFCTFALGCSKDFLDRQPLDQDVTSTFYKSETEAMQALVAVYDVLGYQSAPGVSWAPFLTVSDMLSDDAYAGGGDANDGQDEDELNTYNIPATNGLVHATWLRNYVGINRANLLLEVIERIDLEENLKARIVAEGKFLRAYFYFEQVRFFENIPLLTSTIKGPSGYSQKQSSPQEVYSQIALDLVDAIEVLPTVIDGGELGRASKWAAEALLARVFLFYNGVYNQDLQAGSVSVNRAKALEYLEDVVSNSGHALLENYADIFRSASEFSVESVFEISHGNTPPWWDWDYVRGGEGNLAAQMQGPRVTGSENWDRGWSFAPVTQKLVDDLEGDPRFEPTILTEEELDGSLAKGYQHTGYYSQKYSSDVEHWSVNGQFELNRTCNFRVLRYSDVLLMAAELGSASAQAYLDQVRARVGLEAIPATMENIFNERRLEFALEGHRYFDVIRRGMDYATDQFSLSGERGPNYVGDQQIFDVTFDPSNKGFLPIPLVEIDLSAGVFRQNSGY